MSPGVNAYAFTLVPYAGVLWTKRPSVIEQPIQAASTRCRKTYATRFEPRNSCRGRAASGPACSPVSGVPSPAAAAISATPACARKITIYRAR